MTELELTYPREWAYRIIGTHEKLIRQLVDDILGEHPYEIEPSNESTSGRYVSMHLRVEVMNQAQRDDIFARLIADETVKVVL
ncbi:MAG: HP0495 family protein [Planctomycetota bacterium]